MSAVAGERATIYSVAERAEVSIATVSRVFQNSDKVAPATRERVLAAAASLDYLPDGSAKSLAAKRSGVLGLVVPELVGSYYAELLIGFESAAATAGLSVMLLIAGPDDHTASWRARHLASRVDGMAVMNGPCLIAPDDIERLSHRCAVVELAAGEDTMVTGGNRENARLLTEHLLDHGRRRFAFVGDPDLALDARDRYAGFAAALADAGVAVPAPIRVEFARPGGEEAARRILAAASTPDACVCANDEIALTLQLELRRSGLEVPADLALTGWDDVPAAYYTGLTTVCQPVRELGRAAAERLVALTQVGSPGAPAPDSVPIQLATQPVIRSSCGCDPPSLSPTPSFSATQPSPKETP